MEKRSGLLDRDSSKCGPPLYASPDSRIQLSHIQPQVQLDAILWGIGTTLGELPPYFISRAGTMVPGIKMGRRKRGTNGNVFSASEACPRSLIRCSH
ncbi:unnamed protein product [Camellia sinensis]